MPPPKDTYLGHLRTHTGVRWLGPETGIGAGFIVDNNCTQRQNHALRRMEAGKVRAQLFGVNYVLRGTGTFTSWDGEQHALHPGCYFHFDHTRPYRLAHHDADFSECYIAIHHAIFEPLVTTRVVPPDCVCRDIGLHTSLIAAFAQLRDDLENAGMSTAQILHQTISLIERIQNTHADGRDEAVLHAQVLLGANLDRPMSMTAVAKQLGMSYSYFHRIFTAAMGCSPKEFRIRRRVDAACRLLGSRTPKQVAEELGYCNLHFFSRQFKRYAQVPPRQYVERGPRLHPRF